MIGRRYLVVLVATTVAIVVLTIAAVTFSRELAAELDRFYANGGATSDEVNRDMIRVQVTIMTLGNVVGPLIFAASVPAVAALALVMRRRELYAGSASATASRDASSAASVSAGSAESIS